MPSFFKHVKGVQKPHSKYFLHALKRSGSLHAPAFGFAPAPAFAPIFSAPVSSVFESSDCIWYYGTLYVKEAVAVSKMVNVANNNTSAANTSATNTSAANPNEDDDTESVCSSTSTSIHSGNPNKAARSIAKTNQIRYIHDGTRLRHLVNGNEWHATFDAEPNRIIRTPDGVAFDTLRQFARVHCNEVLGTTSALNNVWSDPQFQYQDDDGQWHPLSVLRTI